MKVNEHKVEIPMADAVAEGYSYEPAEAGGWPGVLFYTDIGGVRSASLEAAERLSQAGFLVLVPNIFYRTSKLPVFKFPIKLGEERTTARFQELSMPLTPDVMEQDAGSYVDFLARQPGVNGRCLGVVGHCYSGAMALRTAAARPDKICALASFHAGRLYTDSPDSPHRVLPRVKAQLYFAHASQDRSMPAEAIQKFEAALRDWGGQYESETYEGAFHGWTVPDSPVYDQPQAERAFQKMSRLFAASLK